MIYLLISSEFTITTALLTAENKQNKTSVLHVRLHNSHSSLPFTFYLGPPLVHLELYGVLYLVTYI